MIIVHWCTIISQQIKTALSCKKYRMPTYGLCAVYPVDIISCISHHILCDSMSCISDCKFYSKQHPFCTYKVLLTKVPSYLHQLLIRRSEKHCRNIRFNTFTIPQHFSIKFEGSFSYRAPTILNKFFEYLNLPEAQYRSKIDKLCVG
jgi:hypothetical protein